MMAKHGSIQKQQIRLIHTLKGKLGWEDDFYRAVLLDVFGVESSTALSHKEAAGMIRALEDRAIAMGVWTARSQVEKYKQLKGREGFATPAQLTLIEGLWKKVSRVDEEDRAKALRSFLQRQTGVSDLRFLKQDEASKFIVALKAMLRQAKDGE